MLLRVPEFRGAQVAAGVVVLTTLAVLLELRMDWSAGGHLAVTGGLAAFVWALVIATGPAEGRARPWLAALCLAAVLLLAVGLGHLVDVIGSRDYYDAGGEHMSRTATFSALVVLVAAAWCARARGAASCALVAGIAGTMALLAFADWVADPGERTFRWLLVLAAFVLLLAAIANRDARPLHAAQYANAGGIAIAAIGSELLLEFVFGGYGDRGVTLGTGWELLMLAAGFGLMGYGAVDGQRGPVVVGLLNTGMFVAGSAVPHGDFVGWPLFLLLAGLAFVVIGLRPTTPAPPEPGIGDEPPPPIQVDVDR